MDQGANQPNQINGLNQPIEPSMPTNMPGPSINPQTPAPSAPPIAPDPSSKKPKALIATTIVCAVLALAGVAFGVYGMFFKPAPECQTDCANTPTSTTPTPDTPTTTDEEVEITDTYVLRDLDEKMAILHDTDEINATINKGTVVGGYSDNIIDMYKIGLLEPSSIRIAYVIDSLQPQFRYLNSEESDAVINNVQPEYREDVRKTTLQGIDGDAVSKKYKDVFGEDIAHESSSDCYAYMYNSTYNFYYKNPIGGCGGTSSYRTFHYKNKYTADANYAYVYVSVALTNAEDNNIYCDISYLDISGPFKLSEDAKICSKLTENTDFSLDESNYQDFAAYRFVFNKAADNTYYFSKVEKI